MNQLIRPRFLNPDNFVQKSRPLLLAEDINFTAGQLKILDTYISCLNSRKPNDTTVVFKLSEYEELLGVSRLRDDRLKKSLSDLLKLQVTVPFKGYKDGFLVCNLFDGALIDTDEATGEKIICLRCSEIAKPLFFNLEQIGYVRYQLRNVIMMKSMYSIYLYQYVKDNLFRGTWEVPTNTLITKHLHVGSNGYRKDFYKFREKILDVAVNEVNKKTDVLVDYEEITISGKIAVIRFSAYNNEKEVKAIEDLIYPNLNKT